MWLIAKEYDQFAKSHTVLYVAPSNEEILTSDLCTPAIPHGIKRVKKDEFTRNELTVLRNFDSECQFVADAHRLDLARPAVENADSRRRRLRCARDADHFRVSDWHHAEGDILRGHIVCALNFVDFVSLCHHHGMVLQYDRVRIDSSLKTVTLPWWKESLNRDLSTQREIDACVFIVSSLSVFVKLKYREKYLFPLFLLFLNQILWFIFRTVFYR